ncbi:MAG: ribose 5-phosphate isomerase B [Phycisphaerales bacterium]|nr:ribose 5-phosphate isomerase B [Phycisphaerales bacterium]
MKIAVGSDHRGFEAKERIKALLQSMGLQVADFGTHDEQPCDYPDAGLAVAQAVSELRADRGVLFCGSGIGMSISANKVHGVRAALCHDELTAQMSRRHNDANVLCLPADLVGDALMQGIVRVWIETEFEGGRHARRVEKIRRFEENHHPTNQAARPCDPAESAPT